MTSAPTHSYLYTSAKTVIMWPCQEAALQVLPMCLSVWLSIYILMSPARCCTSKMDQNC